MEHLPTMDEWLAWIRDTYVVKKWTFDVDAGGYIVLRVTAGRHDLVNYFKQNAMEKGFTNTSGALTEDGHKGAAAQGTLKTIDASQKVPEENKQNK